MGRLILISVLMFASFAGALSAATCMPYEALRLRLLTNYGEVLIWAGVTPNAEHLLIYGTPGGEAFTLIKVDAHARACVLSSGRGWASIDPGKLLDEES